MVRHNFRTLDGLRGLAAILVMLWHVSSSWPGIPYLGSAYLAVDFFFMLSGFVVTHAYEDRLRRDMSPWHFMQIRLVRLYPLYVLGLAIGLAPFLLAVAETHQLWQARDAIGQLPRALLFLPQFGPDGMAFWGLNPPGWSLACELGANAVFAVLLPRLSLRRLILVALLSWSALTILSVRYSTIVFLPAVQDYLTYFLRPGFAYTTGIILYRLWRSDSLPKVHVSPVGIAALFILLLAIPVSGWASAYLVPVALGLGFPVIVWLGACNEPSHRLTPIARESATLSYPLYATHVPLLFLVRAILAGWGIGRAMQDIFAILLICLSAPLLARFYDKPARRWLGGLIGVRRREVEAARGL